MLQAQRVLISFTDLDTSTISDIDSQLSESFNEVLSDTRVLDSSASKSKGQLASSGALASRRPPSKRNKVGCCPTMRNGVKTDSLPYLLFIANDNIKEGKNNFFLRKFCSDINP